MTRVSSTTIRFSLAALALGTLAVGCGGGKTTADGGPAVDASLIDVPDGEIDAPLIDAGPQPDAIDADEDDADIIDAPPIIDANDTDAGPPVDVLILEPDGGPKPDAAHVDAGGPPPAGMLSCARSLGGNGNDMLLGTDIGPDGSIYVTGAFFGTATFGRQGETDGQVVTLTAASSLGDIFVARFNPDCSCLWAKRAGGVGDDSGNGIAVAPDGSVYVTGSFAQSATFGAGEPVHTTLTALGQTDVFVAHYNADGTLNLATSAGGVGGVASGSGVAVAGSALYVVGSFTGTATFGGTTELVVANSFGGGAGFIVQYNASAFTTNWAEFVADGTLGTANATRVVTGPGGDAIFTGNYRGTAAFGPGQEGQRLTSVNDANGVPSTDAFVVRYNGVSGNPTWQKSMGGGGYESETMSRWP